MARSAMNRATASHSEEWRSQHATGSVQEAVRLADAEAGTWRCAVPAVRDAHVGLRSCCWCWASATSCGRTARSRGTPSAWAFVWSPATGIPVAQVFGAAPFWYGTLVTSAGGPGPGRAGQPGHCHLPGRAGARLAALAAGFPHRACWRPCPAWSTAVGPLRAHPHRGPAAALRRSTRPWASCPSFRARCLVPAVWPPRPFLAIMITPTISAVSRDVFRAIPRAQREAALALGATRWEMISQVLVPYGLSGHPGRGDPGSGPCPG